MPWRDVSAMTGEAVLEEIMKVLQSNENFSINDGQMTIQVTVVRLPVGSGRKPLHAGLYFESENMREEQAEYYTDQQYQRCDVYGKSCSGGEM